MTQDTLSAMSTEGSHSLYTHTVQIVAVCTSCSHVRQHIICLHNEA